MEKVIGVRFHRAGRMYSFRPTREKVEAGDYVIVKTAKGVEYGRVVQGPREVQEKNDAKPLKHILRVATEEDRQRYEANKKAAQEAFVICKEKIKKLGMEMKLICAEYTFDRKKITFYFSADGRVDFRELVKILAGIFHARIELRQVGVRDETKLRGGLGVCGRELCCSSFITEFTAVSIKMAKEQNLSLSPGKISGICGRLMCCLVNEQESYEELRRKLPFVGDSVRVPEGLTGEVHSVNALRQKVKVVVTLDNEEKELRTYDATELRFKPKRRKTTVSSEERRQLQELEKDEGASEIDDE